MKTRILLLATYLTLVAAFSFGDSVAAVQPDKLPQSKAIYIRTENYPRPPYSGATYYIYERDNQVICTKLRVCNKYDDCDITYEKGSYKHEYDIETGEPYGKTERVLIPASKLRKHVCLRRFKLIP